MKKINLSLSNKIKVQPLIFSINVIETNCVPTIPPFQLLYNRDVINIWHLVRLC